MRHAVWVGAVAVLLAGGPLAAQERKPDVTTRFGGHLGGVSALAFHPGGTYLATGTGNGVVRVWDPKSSTPAFRFDSQKSSGARINHLGFSAAWRGNLLSTSSRNAVTVWDLTPPPPPPKKEPDPKDPTIDLNEEEPEPKTAPRVLQPIFVDTLGTDPIKLGTVTGDARRAFLASTEGVRIAVGSKAFTPQLGVDSVDDLRGTFTPLAMGAMPDPESSLVALYGTVKNPDRTEQPAVAFVGLGDGKVIARGVVRGPIAGRTPTIAFAPDGKLLVACNGEDLMYWRVPGSQVVEGDPKLLAGMPAFAAAAGPDGRVAFASPPEAGKKVKVTVVDLSGAQPKVVAEYATEIDRVSALAFSPDGNSLAVGDDTEGVVQLWSLLGKK